MIIPIKGITSTMVANELGSESRKWSVLCTHPDINMWARYKPVRYGSSASITETTRKAVQYGLFPAGSNTPTEPSFNATSPFFVYRKPRGAAYGERYRIGDFLNPKSTIEGSDMTLTGYNHNAECFIVDDTNEKRLTFNKIFELPSSSAGGTYGGKMDMTRILNNGINVELGPEQLNVSITWESYVGIFFYNVTTNEKFYNVYKVKWSELANSNLSWADFFPTNVSASRNGNHVTWSEHFYYTADQLRINNGDKIHAYYCSVPLQFYNSLGQPDQWREDAQNENYWKNKFDSEQVIYFITRGLNAIQIFAPTATNGHGIIDVSKFDFTDKTQLKLYNGLSPLSLYNDNKLVFNISRNASGVVSCSSVWVPMSIYYFSKLAGYDTSLVSPLVNTEIKVTAAGKTLLNQTVSKSINSTYREVSGTSPSDGSANFYAKTSGSIPGDTTIIPTNEIATFYVEVTSVSVDGKVRRPLIRGNCKMSTGGVQTWSFQQV